MCVLSYVWNYSLGLVESKSVQAYICSQFFLHLLQCASWQDVSHRSHTDPDCSSNYNIRRHHSYGSHQIIARQLAQTTRLTLMNLSRSDLSRIFMKDVFFCWLYVGQRSVTKCSDYIRQTWIHRQSIFFYSDFWQNSWDPRGQAARQESLLAREWWWTLDEYISYISTDDITWCSQSRSRD